MSDEQDIRKMGGIWKHVKLTYAMMWIGSLALAGVPFFAGYYSKDMILESAYAAGTGVGYLAFALGIAAAFMTAFYSWRLLILTFHGKPRADEYVMSHIHESPPVMTIPLVLLAIGAIFSGWLGYELFVGDAAVRQEFWGAAIYLLPGRDTVEAAHYVPTWVILLPLVVTALGIALAYALYMLRPDIPGKVAERFRPVYLFLLNKWYFDELYDRVFVRPSMKLGRALWKGGDGALIDGVGPDGVAAATKDIASKLGKMHSGLLYHYAFAMIIGVAVLVTWFMINAG